MELTNRQENEIETPLTPGTLAIDLGNSTTVVSFQGEKDSQATLLDLFPISRSPGEVPSLIWYPSEKESNCLIGQEVIEAGLASSSEENLSSDFKRWIGATDTQNINKSNITPEKAGELLIQRVWQSLPKDLFVKRLVLTAPVETYKEYRAWLNNVCNDLPIDEIALVDEPTAAAMGAGLNAGSKIMVVDIGGSTIDISLVGLEGGEGKAEPIAQLIKFKGENLEGRSKQILRCAKVLGKAGQRLGGRDIDRWIANNQYPQDKITEQLLNAAERLKCRLSKINIKSTEHLLEVEKENDSNKVIYELTLSRKELEEILTEKGLLKIVSDLLDKTLDMGELNGCKPADITGVVLVGGGAHIPIIQRLLEEKIQPTPLLKPPPIEAVALGALYLTPGVTIKDVLQYGVSLRCWDQKSSKHIWHPLFLPGHPWPTSKPLELILSASKVDQAEIELVIGEPELYGSYEVKYLNGVPTIEKNPNDPKVIPWREEILQIALNPLGQPGEDCVKLNFNINKNAELEIEGKDIRSQEIFLRKIVGKVK